MHRNGALFIVIGMLLTAASASADVVDRVSVGGSLLPSQSWLSTAPGQTPITVSGTGTNNGSGPVTVNDLTASGAGAFLFSQTLVAPQGSFAAADQINGAAYGFTTSYVISVPPSMASAFLFSLNLSSAVGLEDLSARLYEYSANGVTNLTLGGTGPVANGNMETWSASVNSNGTNPIASTSLPATTLSNGGEFVLEISGLETGSQNGSFSGQLDVTPVPLPAALPLMLTALGLLSSKARRRKAA